MTSDTLFEVPGAVLDTLPGKELVTITVYGTPEPQGNKTGFATFRTVNGQREYTGKVAMREGKTAAARDRHKSWRALVAEAARDAMAGAEPVTGAVAIRVTFTMPRPKNHYGTGRNAGILKGSAPTWHTSRPDRGKLERAVEDSLKDGGVYRDDSQAAACAAFKVYTSSPLAPVEDTLQIPGVVIRVWVMP